MWKFKWSRTNYGYHANLTPKGEKYALLLDGGLVIGYPRRIWVIIDTPHAACHIGD